MTGFQPWVLLWAGAALLLSGIVAVPQQAAAQVGGCAVAPGDVIECNGSFRGRLVYDDDTNERVLRDEAGEVDRTITNLQGVDTLALNGDEVGDNDLFRVETTAGGITVDQLNLRGGDDSVTINRSALNGTIIGGPGNDTFVVNGTDGIAQGPPTTADGFAIRGGNDDDTIRIIASGPAGIRSIDGGSGLDTIELSADAVIEGDLFGGPDDDTIASSGVVSGAINAGVGNDAVRIDGGSVGSVRGGAGDADTLALTRGRLDGVIDGFEAITITPDRDALGGAPAFTGNANVSGRNAAVTLSGVETADLFNPDLQLTIGRLQSIRVTNSTIEGLSGVLNAEAAVIENGSLVGFIGNSRLRSVNGPNAALTVRDSTLDFVDGDASGGLTVDELTLANTSLRVDYDPERGVADTVTVRIDDAFDTTAGDNRLFVAPTDRPVTPGTFTTAIVEFEGEANPDPDDAPFGAGFDETVIQMGPNANPLLALSLLQGPEGGLYLRSAQADETPVDPGVINAPSVDTISGTSEDVVTEITNEALGTGPTTARTQITPVFGVFSNGSFGKSYHDGFSASALGTTLNTPEFDADNFSVIAAGELDASAQFDLEDIGVRVSGFGGYVYSDVDVDRTSNLAFGGGGTNRGGVFGASVLLSKIQGLGNLNYAVLSGAGFFGATEFQNGRTGGTGDYGTQGFLVGAKLGRNMAVSDDVRLDVRVGGLYNAFYGDAFRDTSGFVFGESETSYGQVSLETGVSTAFAFGGVVVRPTGRLMAMQRIGYTNTSEVNGIDFEFDDADFSLGAQLGATSAVTERIKLGAFVEGRASSDQEQILGKLSLKYQFGGGR